MKLRLWTKNREKLCYWDTLLNYNCTVWSNLFQCEEDDSKWNKSTNEKDAVPYCLISRIIVFLWLLAKSIPSLPQSSHNWSFPTVHHICSGVSMTLEWLKISVWKSKYFCHMFFHYQFLVTYLSFNQFSVDGNAVREQPYGCTFAELPFMRRKL